MAFPTPSNVIVSVAILLVGAPIVYFLSKALKLHPKPIAIADTRKESKMAFLLTALVFVATVLLVIFVNTVLSPLLQLDKRPPYLYLVGILIQVFFYGVWFVPLVLFMKRTKQNRGSIGISRENMRRILVVGFTLSAVYFAVEGFLAPSLGGGFTGFSTSLIYQFIVNAIVGFSEETVFRGYIQTRLAAYSGTLKGLLVTSMLFALYHFPIRYYQFSGAPLEALASALLVFPAGILLGYIMLRCQNIIPSSVFHFFFNWSTIFWHIPQF